MAEGALKCSSQSFNFLDSSHRLGPYVAVLRRDWRLKGLSPLLSRHYTTNESPEESDRQKWEGEGTLKDSRQLKAEFEAARKVFADIPDAIYALPKMNPNGTADPP